MSERTGIDIKDLEVGGPGLSFQGDYDLTKYIKIQCHLILISIKF